MKISTIVVSLTSLAAMSIALGFTPRIAPGHSLESPRSSENASMMASNATSEVTEFRIDPVHSTSIFRVHHLKAGMFYGRFDRVTGTFSLNPEAIEESSFNVSIDVESIHTGSEEMNANLNKHLMSPDFFNAKEHGTMTFTSTSVTKVDDDTIEVKGDLTIRGTTKSITTNIDLTGYNESRRGTKAGFETNFTIKRTDFGVDYMADGGMLGTEVKIIISMEGNAS